jgi:hypothetical protein
MNASCCATLLRWTWKYRTTQCMESRSTVHLQYFLSRGIVVDTHCTARHRSSIYSEYRTTECRCLELHFTKVGACFLPGPTPFTTSTTLWFAEPFDEAFNIMSLMGSGCLLFATKFQYCCCYHHITGRCIFNCHELFLWLSDGPFVRYAGIAVTYLPTCRRTGEGRIVGDRMDVEPCVC